MGIWTWLDRYDGRCFERAAAAASATCVDGLLGAASDDPAAFGHVAGMHTRRVWHAVHVALTGEETGGEAPACHVLWTTPGAVEVSMTDARFIHTVQTVREVADYLRTLDEQRLVANLHAARELGVYVYCFEDRQGGRDMVESGEFGELFRALVTFYSAAADGEQVVVVNRG